MSQQQEPNDASNLVLGSSNVSNTAANSDSSHQHVEDLISSLLPCEAYEKDGFCARGSTCKFKHESAIGNVNLIEFLFEYETIVPKATSKKVRKINETNSSMDTKKTNTSTSSGDQKPIIRKSKKTKIEKKIPDNNSGASTSSSSTNQSSASNSAPEEPFDVPPEYAEINFEKPIIPFNFSFHTPTFFRQSTLQELIDINMKTTTNRKKAVVLAFTKEKEIYTSSHDKVSYSRTLTKYKKTLLTANNKK